MSYKYRENPSNLDCFRLCSSCYRCENKGRYTKCNSCSGRHDPELRKPPDDFVDRCRCPEGILQRRLQDGRMIIAKFPGNPYKGSITGDAVTEDERDWDSALNDMREKLGNEHYDPLQFDQGGSADKWLKDQRGEGV